MVRVLYKKIIAIILAGLLIILLVTGMPVLASNEGSIEANVVVLGGEVMSYGVRVVESQDVLFPTKALDEPDEQSSFIFQNGWMNIEFESIVSNTGLISIWVANIGLHPSHMKISVSADGRKWKQVSNEKVSSVNILRYDFTGSFGDVKYIKVDRNGWPFAFLCLDAIGAKGGE